MKREAVETYGLAGLGAAQGVWRYYIRPEITAKRTWGLIGVIALAHEVVCPPGELLSEGADRAIERHPFLTRFVGAVAAAHVLNAVDERVDLIHHGFRLLKGS